MLYEMAALHPAFDAYNLISLFFKIVRGHYEVSDMVFLYTNSGNYSNYSKTLVSCDEVTVNRC